jgi:type IV secretion system protein VirD4
MDNQAASRAYLFFVIVAAYAALVALAATLADQPWHPLAPLMAAKQFKLAWPDVLKWSYFAVFGVFFAAVVFNPFNGTVKIHGNAHFATGRDIKEMDLRAKSGLILGSKNGAWLRTAKPLSVLVFAPPGTGKTAAEVIPSLLASEASTITYDPKGELLAKTGPWRSQFSKVMKFAPGETDSLSWNPLAKAELPNDWADIEVYVSRIAQSLLPAPKSGDDHWMMEARHVFMFWGLHLIHKNGGTSFSEVLTNALTDDPQGAVQEILDFPELSLPSRVVLEGNALASKADKEFSGVMSSFVKGMDIFLDPRVAKNTTNPDIRLSDLRSTRMSVYLVVSNQDSTRLKPILSLFCEMTANMALGKEPEADEYSITFFLDEFVRLGQMNELKRVPAIGRSYRLNCVFVVQTLAQLRDIYGADGAEEFMGTCSYQVFFTQNEPRVAEMLSKAIGTKTVKTKSTSGRMLDAKSTSTGETGIPLLRGEELLSLPFGDVIILAQNHYNTPIRARAAFWFKDRNLRKCVNFEAGNFLYVPPSAPDAPKAEAVPVPPAESPAPAPEESLIEAPEMAPEGLEADSMDIDEAFTPVEPSGWSDDDLDGQEARA